MKKLFKIIVPVLMMVTALGLGLYPYYSQWWNDRIHAEVLSQLNDVVAVGPEERLENIRQAAHEYNQKFIATGDNSDYMQQLSPIDGSDLMGRIKIPSINVDIPIYHTSSDAILRKGAGHMEETTLPVGGKSTHAAITAHRGLAESVLFTNLDKVKVGDTFTIEVLGEPIVYQVETVRIVAPTETDWLKVDPDRDLVTLITCDPLGINTERMLVTGERTLPTPIKAIKEANAPVETGGIPWWIIVVVAGVIVTSYLAYWSTNSKK